MTSTSTKFDMYYYLFLSENQRKTITFYKTCKLKERKRSIHKVYYLNYSIQSIFCLKLFAKSCGGRPESAKHATNEDNMANGSLAETQQCLSEADFRFFFPFQSQMWKL